MTIWNIVLDIHKELCVNMAHSFRVKYFCIFWSKLDKLYSIHFCRVSNLLNICVHKQVLIYRTSYDYLLWKQAPPTCWQAFSRMSEQSLIQHFCIFMSGRNWWPIYILIFPFSISIWKKWAQYVVIDTKGWGENKKPYSVHFDFSILLIPRGTWFI